MFNVGSVFFGGIFYGGGGGGGTVESVSGAEGVSVDNSDPDNPVVELGDDTNGSSVPFTQGRFLDLADFNLLFWFDGVSTGDGIEVSGSNKYLEIFNQAGDFLQLGATGSLYQDTAGDESFWTTIYIEFTAPGGLPLSILGPNNLTLEDGTFNSIFAAADWQIGTAIGMDPEVYIQNTQIQLINSASGIGTAFQSSNWTMQNNSDHTIFTTMELNNLLMQDSGGVDNMELTELALNFANAASQTSGLTAGEFAMDDPAASQSLGATAQLGYFAQAVAFPNATMFITSDGFNWQEEGAGGQSYATLSGGELQLYDYLNLFLNTIGADAQTMENETTTNTLNLTPDSLFLSDTAADFETLFTKASGYIGKPAGQTQQGILDIWGGGLTTNDPDSSTNDSVWQFGANVAAVSVVDLTKYLAVWINGTRYKLATMS